MPLLDASDAPPPLKNGDQENTTPKKEDLLIQLEKSSRKSWRRRLNRWQGAIKRKPLIATLAAFILFIGILSIGQYANFRIQNHYESTRLLTLPAIGVGDLATELKEGGITTVERSVLRTGSWLDGRATTVFEATRANGNKTVSVIPRELAENEYFTKPLYEALGMSSISLTNGLSVTEFDRGPLMAFFSVLPFIAFLLILMVVGQELVQTHLSKHSVTPTKPDEDVTFDSVIGHDAVKDELRMVRDHLKNPKIFQESGLQAPKGILFSGDPGVGKTLLAKAMANEIKADFFSCAASDFVELYVGMGARRVRGLFAKARLAERAVIFIDEFDAIGSREDRNTDSERLSTLNALLTEMDGMSGNGQVLVLAATNRPDKIDPALKRPGRFDKIVRLGLPDQPTRLKMLQYYTRRFSLAEDVDLQRVAARTAGYSGAQLRETIEEAKRIAWKSAGAPTENRQENDYLFQIKATDILNAQENLLLGPGYNVLHPSEIERVTVHELGHALVGHQMCPEMLVEKVTIEGKGQSLGYTITSPQDERRLRTEASLRGEIAMLLGGRAAEEVLLDSVSSGARDDLNRANHLALTMVADLGMGSSTGLRTWDPNTAPGPAPEMVEKEVRLILETAYNEATSIVRERIVWMRGQAQALMVAGARSREALFESEEARNWMAAIDSTPPTRIDLEKP